MNIQISNVAIRQNDNQFYNLNDLHKASGAEKKHQPAFWLRSEQTKELISEIEAEGKIACTTSQGGKNRGTFVCKELVYAYATWINAKFFLLVIRTFDAAANAMAAQLQQRMSNQDLGDILSECFADTQQRQHNTLALPQNLTSQQQSEVKKFHRQLVQAVPKEQQAKLALTLWSSVKSKFGVSYKQVPTEQYTEILSLMARVAVEKSSALHGELLDKQPEKINAHELADFELARVTQYLQQSYMMMQLMFRAHVGGGLSNEYSQELRQRLHDNLPFLRGLVYQLNRFRGKIHDPLSAKQFNEHMAFLNQITPRCLEIA